MAAGDVRECGFLPPATSKRPSSSSSMTSMHHQRRRTSNILSQKLHRTTAPVLRALSAHNLLHLLSRYQLYGQPTLTPVNKVRRQLTEDQLKESRTIKEDMVLKDRSGSVMQVFDGA